MSNYLEGLEVFGFEKVEPAILAALVTEDPLLLIGRSGTGKTFLLRNINKSFHSYQHLRYFSKLCYSL